MSVAKIISGRITGFMRNEGGAVSGASTAGGILTVTGDFVQKNPGKLDLDIRSASVDRLAVGGKAVVGGTLLFRTMGTKVPAGFWRYVVGAKNFGVLRKKGTDTHC